MKIFVLLLALICCTAFHWTCSAKDLLIGNRAPQFALLNQNGEMVNLNDFKGQKVALYF